MELIIKLKRREEKRSGEGGERESTAVCMLATGVWFRPHLDTNFLHRRWREQSSNRGDDRTSETTHDDRIAFMQHAVDENDIDRRPQPLDDLHLQHRTCEFGYVAETLIHHVLSQLNQEHQKIRNTDIRESGEQKNEATKQVSLSKIETDESRIDVGSVLGLFAQRDSHLRCCVASRIVTIKFSYLTDFRQCAPREEKRKDREYRACVECAVCALTLHR
jgi:hypothetical protein